MPAVAAVTERGAWVAYQSWDGQADRLAIRPLAGEGAEPFFMYRSPGRILGVAAAEAPGGCLDVVWSESTEDGWVLREQRVTLPEDEGQTPVAQAPHTIKESSGFRFLLPQLIEGPEGGRLLLWQEVSEEGTSVAAAWRGELSADGGGWGPALRLSGEGASAWLPQGVGLTSDRFAVVWDSSFDGDYDVVLCRVAVQSDGHLIVTSQNRLTETPRFEAGASVAADGERLYVAYHVGPENWGREGSVNKLEEALHSERTIEILAVEGDRKYSLPDGIFDGFESLALSKNGEQPRLIVDAAGALYLFFRGLPLPSSIQDPLSSAFQEFSETKSGGKGWRTSIWFSYWSRYDGEKWWGGGRHHEGLAGSEGRCEAPIALGRMKGGGVGYAVVGDGRTVEEMSSATGQTINVSGLSWWKPVSSESTKVTTGRIRKANRPVVISLEGGTPLAPMLPVQDRDAAPQRRGADGRLLTMALGDLHRHTDLSRCSSNWDGPFTDAFRYAFDVAPLDFLAITDHFEHMTAYDWWRTASWVDAFHAPGHLVNLHAYERADAWTGHRNVVTGAGPPPLVGYRKSYDPARDAGIADEPPQLWAHFEGQPVLTIPHTPAGMFEDSGIVFQWKHFDPAWDRLIEVWQGYRGSSEADGAPRSIPGLESRRYCLPHLDQGLHFGLIASSDHQSSHGAFAGAWAEEITRAGIFEALYQRRTFASTAKMSLWAEWNGYPMGVSSSTDPGPGVFSLEVDGFGRDLSKVVLVVDGKEHAERAVTGTEVTVTFDVAIPANEERFAYARVVFADGELGWTSPIRLGPPKVWAGPDGSTDHLHEDGH